MATVKTNTIHPIIYLIPSVTILTAYIILILSCSPPPEQTSIPEKAAGEGTSGYMSMSDWEKARLSIATFEEFNKNEMDKFLTASGLAISHRDFGQYDQAIEATKKIPATIDALESALPKFKPVPNYPEINAMRENLAKMVSPLRRYAENLVKSLEAARAGNGAAEKALREVYTNDHRAAMAFYRKGFDSFGEMLTRGGRTESQKLTGVKRGGPAVISAFRKAAGEISSMYRGVVSKEVPVAERHTAARRYDQAIEQSDKIYSMVQRIIMEMNRLDPGNEKALWEVKQTLTIALSYGMYIEQKRKEYLGKLKSGDSGGASATKKQLDLYKKLANEEWAKYRRMRY